MARFIFKLTRLLEQRRRVEREKQKQVAVLETERQRLEDAIRASQSRVMACKQDLRDALRGEQDMDDAGALDLVGVRRQANASLQELMRTQTLVLELAGVVKRVDSARLELLEAATRRRAIELLRDRKQAEWRREQERRESAALDELAMSGPQRMWDEFAAERA